uniref:MORN repeat containing 1 n=1 Tax=Chelydra serpentina TaxID=8475 RepID=A0A8C3SMT7_CHESE
MLSTKNGEKYEGDWILDQRQGHGVLHCADGTVYEGQWRNDVFNGQGTKIHCSGVIYDGLWINGYPAAQAKKIVILGPEVIDVIQGSAITLHVQLQNEEGEVSECKNMFTDIFCHIKIWELKAAVPVSGKSGFALADLPIPKGDIEPESRSDTLLGAGDAPSNEDASQRVQHGCVVFRNIMLAPPPAHYQPFMLLDELNKAAAGSRPPGSAVEPGGSRPLPRKSWCPRRLPRYVIMVHEVTMPPFLGQTLPPAFKLLRVLPEKTKSQDPYPAPSEVSGIFTIEYNGSWIEFLSLDHAHAVGV